MKKYTVLPRFVFTLLVFVSLAVNSANGQNSLPLASNSDSYITFNNLKMKNVDVNKGYLGESDADKLSVEPITEAEEELSRDLNSNWAWAEHTLNIIDSYSPFLFRTRKSAKLEEVKLLLQVDSMGKISGYEVLSSSDKGLRERLDHVIHKIPNCNSVTGLSSYQCETFELIIRK